MNAYKKLLVEEIQKNEGLLNLVRELIKATFLVERDVAIALVYFNEQEEHFSTNHFIPDLNSLKRGIESCKKMNKEGSEETN